jgi:hypothetical protein
MFIKKSINWGKKQKQKIDCRDGKIPDWTRRATNEKCRLVLVEHCVLRECIGSEVYVSRAETLKMMLHLWESACESKFEFLETVDGVACIKFYILSI